MPRGDYKFVGENQDSFTFLTPFLNTRKGYVGKINQSPGTTRNGFIILIPRCSLLVKVNIDREQAMMIGGSTSTSTSTRELSLVEQKRLQWQKEREEIDRIGSEIFSHSQTNYEKTCIKTYFSNVDLSRSTSHFDEPVARNFQHFPATPQSSTNYNHYGFRPPIPTPAPSDQHTGARAMRSPSLPPIPREKYYNYNPNGQTLVINPGHSDTGYHSESSPPNNDGPIQVWTNDDDGRGSNKTVTLRSRSRPEVNGRPHFQEAHQVQSINK